jgi:uncharacterized lipoprotein
MKNLIILTALAIGLFACSSDHEKKQQENIELVKNYIHAVETLIMNPWITTWM